MRFNVVAFYFLWQSLVGHTRYPRSKTVLLITEQFIACHMSLYLFSEERLHYFTEGKCQDYWPVISRQTLVSFLEYRNNVNPSLFSLGWVDYQTPATFWRYLVVCYGFVILGAISFSNLRWTPPGPDDLPIFRFCRRLRMDSSVMCVFLEVRFP